MGSSVHVEGIFDAAAARRVRDALATAGPGDALAIDLTHVRELHDVGVAMLAEALRATLARVAVMGLTQHQRRMLRYLGIEPSGASTADASTPLRSAS